jgi:hypothetical protein
LLGVETSPAVPTPRLTEPEALKEADVAVEGHVVGVALTKRWLGTRPGQQGYEHAGLGRARQGRLALRPR